MLAQLSGHQRQMSPGLWYFLENRSFFSQNFSFTDITWTVIPLMHFAYIMQDPLYVSSISLSSNRCYSAIVALHVLFIIACISMNNTKNGKFAWIYSCVCRDTGAMCNMWEKTCVVWEVWMMLCICIFLPLLFEMLLNTQSMLSIYPEWVVCPWDGLLTISRIVKRIEKKENSWDLTGFWKSQDVDIGVQSHTDSRPGIVKATVRSTV